MPRFAVCVCGDVRGFSRIAWALESRLLEPTRRSGGEVDLFFHVWSDGSPLEQMGVAAMQHMPRAVHISVEPTSERLNLTAATYSWGNSRRMAASGSFESFRSQWRKVHLCFAAAHAHARSMGLEYDAYVRTRADILHLVEYDLATDHRRMTHRARIGGSAEYVAMQACLSPWPTAVQDQWFVATPTAAQAIAELPTQEEPPCCEAWMEHRLQSTGVVEPPEGADAGHPSACLRAHKVGRAPRSGSSGGPIFFLSRMHAIHLGSRCFSVKMAGKKRLPQGHTSCRRVSAPGVDPTLNPRFGVVAELALRHRGSEPKAPGARHDALLRLLGNNETNASKAKPMQTIHLLRRAACRCANGAAAVRSAVPVPRGQLQIGIAIREQTFRL